MMGLFHQVNEIEKLGKVFEHIDADKDGYITLREIKECFNPSQKNIVNILGKVPDWETTFAALDTDNDGRMDFNEFL